MSIRNSTVRDWAGWIAVIGDSANAASIALHAAADFRLIGTLKSVGFKHGRWLDTVVMQRALGSADASPP
jgi:L-amino acid N-acyltransferase YncA